jgi:EmrB/QacA subfamily drug resistance transporter
VEAIGSVAKTAVAGGTPAVVGGVDRIVLTAAGPDDLVRMGTPQGRWVLTATILASGMAFLDGTVVNVALRAIGNDLDADLGDLQWVVSAYMLTLASLILVAGSLGDIVGRRRVFLVGVIWFAVASVLCGLAPNPLTLIVARALQGVGGALLTPGSLAILQSGFRPEDRARAIGAWSGLAGVSTAIGPFLGGWLVIEASWRWIFWINVPLAAVVVLVTLRHVPTSCNSTMGTGRRLDTVGALLGSLGLAGLTFALIEAGSGVTTLVAAAGIAGVVVLVAFVVSQRRSVAPMVPPRLFASRTFTTTNALTLVVYAALAVMSFFLVLQLQVSLGWTPLAAGASMLPVTVLMLLFSAQAGALAQRIGPRLPLTVGPLLAAVGVGWLVGVGPGDDYLPDIFPALAVFGVGLTLIVAPLTATVLAAAPDAMAGVASGVNNAVARTGSLLAVAALPLAVGLSGADYESASAFGAGYRDAMIICAVLLVLGGLSALLGLPSAADTTKGHRAQLQPETSG